MNGTIAKSSLVAKPAALTDHIYFLGNLATALGQTVEDARKMLEGEERYFSAFENGEGVLPREVASKKQQLDNKKAAVSCLQQMVKGAEVGNLCLPVGSAVACLQPTSDQPPSVVFILPSEVIPRLVENNDAPEAEGVQLFFFDHHDDTARLLEMTRPGQLVHVPWSEKDYVMKEFIPGPLASSN